MSSFRQSCTVIRRVGGGYTNGMPNPLVESSFTMFASIQPVKDNELIMDAQGNRVVDAVRVYTDRQLQTAEDGEPDLIVWQGKRYKCIKNAVRQMNVINHYRYIFEKVER